MQTTQHFMPRWTNVCHSTLEGGPITIEAMAAGTTPVVSNTGFAAQIIEQGVTGHIVEHDTSVRNFLTVERTLFKFNKIKGATKSWSWNEMGKLIADKILEYIFPNVSRMMICNSKSSFNSSQKIGSLTTRKIF